MSREGEGEDRPVYSPQRNTSASTRRKRYKGKGSVQEKMSFADVSEPTTEKTRAGRQIVLANRLRPYFPHRRDISPGLAYRVTGGCGTYDSGIMSEDPGATCDVSDKEEGDDGERRLEDRL
jgi:hypothetical protein